MSAITQEKNTIRQRLITQRKTMPPLERIQANEVLIQRALSHDCLGSTLACYWPTLMEPGGSDLVPALTAIAQAVYLPRCLPGGQLTWGRYTGPESVSTGAYGITEPIDAQLTSAELLPTVDILFVPAVAAGPDGSRLGKGGGFYDRALAAGGPAATALVFEHEFFPVPREEHDQPVGWVITPSGNHRTV